MVSAWVMNGSGAQIASTWPEFRAARIAGNGIATNLTESWSTLNLLSAARITISQTPLSAFPAIVLPSRSFGVLIELDPLTMTFCQLSSIEVASLSLAETRHHRDPLRAGDDRRHPADVPDVAVVVGHREDDVVPALEDRLLDLDAALREEPLRDADVEREAVGDRQTVEVDRRKLPVLLRWASLPPARRARAAGRPRRRAQESERAGESWCVSSHVPPRPL